MIQKIENPAIEKEIIKIIQMILEDDTMEIDPEKSLMLDYGLDSLDLLDLSFNIEEKYDVQIGADELKGRAQTRLSKEEMFDDNGNISHQALEALKENIPEINPELIVYGLRPEDIPSLLNVRVFVRIIHEKIKENK